MSAAAEFFLIAIAIYLWESGFWLPLRAAVLRKRPFSRRWHALRPGQWMSTKELGLVAAVPLVPDVGFAPCQSPPLLTAEDGTVLVESAEGDLVETEATSWDDITVESGKLVTGGVAARISSARMVDLFRRAKKRGLHPAEGIADAWKKAMSPQRAAREWYKWQLVGSPLVPLCLMLTIGFFIGLPLAYLRAGLLPTLGLCLFLWFVMFLIGIRLWWLSRRAYPAARSALRSDAALSCIVPFHAMRAFELASVHAMATTHPAALLLSTGDTDNRWLAEFSRHMIHARPRVPYDDSRTALIRPLLETALARHGRKVTDYDTVPSRDEDPDATCYCPRCHAVFGEQLDTCSDCRGVPLKAFP